MDGNEGRRVLVINGFHPFGHGVGRVVEKKSGNTPGGRIRKDLTTRGETTKTRRMSTAATGKISGSTGGIWYLTRGSLGQRRTGRRTRKREEEAGQETGEEDEAERVREKGHGCSSGG